MLYILSLDNNFAKFIDSEWEKKASNNPFMGLTTDPDRTENGLSVVQINAHLDLMLGQ